MIEMITTILSVISTTGFIVTIATLRSERRKRQAEAGITELDWRKAEIEVNKLEDESEREQRLFVIDELSKVRALLHEAKTMLTAKELEVIDWTRRALIAEKSKCERWDCLDRIPPIKEEDYSKIIK